LEGLGKKLPGESEEIETGIEIRRESEKIIVSYNFFKIN